MGHGFPDWTRAFLLMGKHDSDFLPVLVGADGSMYAVLQGEYEGALRTVKLDDEGRISAFVIDTADQWGNMLAVGNAELASRLVGWPVSYDRRGQVLFHEDFDDGYSNLTPVTSHGGTVSLTPTFALQGGYSALLHVPSDAEAYAGVAGNYPTPAPALSFGLSAFIVVNGEFEDIRLVLHYDEPPTRTQMVVKCTQSDLKLWVLNAAGAWEEIGTWVTPLAYWPIWYHLKLVGSVADLKYKRVMFQGQEIDVSSIGLYQDAINVSMVRIGVYMYGRVGLPGNGMVDCVTLTTQEA